MSKINLVTSFGHAGTVNVSHLENIAAASKGYIVHAANIPSSAQEVVDKGQQAISKVATEGAELPQVITAAIPTSVSTLAHTWTTSPIRMAYPIAEVLPQLEGWL